MMELLIGVASSGRLFWRRNLSRSTSAVCEEPGEEARISKAYLPEADVMAIGHEPERGKGLLLGDLGDVVPELFVGLRARIAGASLGLNDGENVTACIVQAIVGDAVPWLRVIAINWNLKSDLRTVGKFPASGPQLWINLQDTVWASLARPDIC